MFKNKNLQKNLNKKRNFTKELLLSVLTAKEPLFKIKKSANIVFCFFFQFKTIVKNKINILLLCNA